MRYVEITTRRALARRFIAAPSAREGVGRLARPTRLGRREVRGHGAVL
jgi:hypothetical protein